MADIGTILLPAVAASLLAIVAVRHPDRLKDVFGQLRSQAANTVISVPLGILIAAFLSRMLPADAITFLIGKESGIYGILIASVLGGFIPGGPMVAFPIAVTMLAIGAGQPQMIALLTSWSVFAVHRILTYELPLMGNRFVAVRLMAVGIMPPLAGTAAYLMTGF
jgi:uncharacterized membrane protein YraQ (UPF0718 family)